MLEIKNNDEGENKVDSEYVKLENLNISKEDINIRLKKLSDIAYKSVSGNNIIQLPRERLEPKEITETEDPKQSNIQKIKESIEIKGELANIKEVKNSQGDSILECKGTTPYIHKNALEDIIGFAQEFFDNTGTALTINNAFRTMSYQNKLKNTKGENAAEPGKSGHNLGLSIDMDRTDRYNPKNGGLNGMKILAKKYGFISNISGEDRHFDHISLPKIDERLAMAKNIEKSRKYNT